MKDFKNLNYDHIDMTIRFNITSESKDLTNFKNTKPWKHNFNLKTVNFPIIIRTLGMIERGTYA